MWPVFLWHGEEPGVRTPCAPWFLPQPGDRQPSRVQGANPAQWQKPR